MDSPIEPLLVRKSAHEKPVADSGVAIDNGHDLSLEGSVISSDEWWLPRQPAGNRLGVTTSSACTEIIHKTPPFVDTSPSKTEAVKSGFGEAFCLSHCVRANRVIIIASRFVRFNLDP